MTTSGNTWALVLAGGDGNRLRSLTTRPGVSAVPKQFCPSMAVRRCSRMPSIGRRRSPPKRTLRPSLRISINNGGRISIASAGSARATSLCSRAIAARVGALYALLHITARDPHAHVALLPADHHVSDESILHESLLCAARLAQRDPTRAIILGLEPDEPDPDLGYIVPGAAGPLGGRAVARFIEKPDWRSAGELIAAGALWNSFILCATAQSLIDLYLPRYAALVTEMRVVLNRGFASHSPTAAWPALVAMYERMPVLDFSRDLLKGREDRLRVLPTPGCGWSDLGTPRRVAEALRKLRPVENPRADLRPACLDLAVQHARYADPYAGDRQEAITG